MSKIFWSNYEKWEQESLKEFKESEYWNEDYNSGHLEITECGSVYLGNLHWIKNAVTSWEDSEFFVE